MAISFLLAALGVILISFAYGSLTASPGLQAHPQYSDYAVVRWSALAIFDFLCELFDGRASIERAR
jgi:hypothetical protein